MAGGLLFQSCESLFTTNLFAGIDKLDLSKMSSEEKAVAVLDDPEGALEDLSDTEVEELLTDLADLYNDTSEDDSTREQAAAAAAAVELAQAGADDTINNLGDVAADLINDDLTIEDAGDLLSTIFSDENGNPLDQTEVETQLTAILAAAAALEVYGDVLGDGGSAPAGVSPNELAVTALVAGMVNFLVDPNNVETSVTAIAADIVNGTITTLGGLPDLSVISTNPEAALFPENDGLANVVEGSDLITSLLDLMA